ncbi:hypothetical protein CRYUN_Cryun10bG0048000 [Craigia yunnanensis]
MVVRDHAGTITYCAVTRVGDVDSPLHAEFLAILFGLEECWNTVNNFLFIESDLLLSIWEIEVGPGSFCEGVSNISDVLNLFIHYDFSSFYHTNRNSNGCTHNLVKIPSSLGEYKVWRNSLPPSFCNPDLIEV